MDAVAVVAAGQYYSSWEHFVNGPKAHISFARLLCGPQRVHSEHVALETNAAEIARYMNAEFVSSMGGYDPDGYVL
jgi:hypothetical protein